MIPGEIMRATVRYSAPGASIAQNVFHWRLAGSGTDDTVASDKVLDWLENAWGPTWGALANNQAELDSVETSIVNDDGTLNRAVAFDIIGIAGLLMESVSPAGVAAYIALKTIVPRVGGSKYIPFLSEFVTADGLMTPQGLIDMAQLLLFYFDDLSLATGDSLETGVVSSKTIQFEPFLATADLDAIPAYQRRRKQGVGS